MTPLNSILLIIFGVVGYMMIVDKNVSTYLTLVFKTIEINIKRFFWMLNFHPKNPIVNFIRRIEYNKIAKELRKELIESK